MPAGTDKTSAPLWGLLGICAAFLAFHLLTTWRGETWAGDSAQYIIHALNLLHGQPYTANYMVPGERFPAYPPVFPCC